MKITPNMIIKLFLLLLCGYSLLESENIDHKKDTTPKTTKKRKGQQEVASVPEMALRILILVFIIAIIIKYWVVGINMILQVLFKLWHFIDQFRWGISLGSTIVSYKHATYAAILFASATALTASGIGIGAAAILTDMAIDQLIEAGLWGAITQLITTFNIYSDIEFGSPTNRDEECVIKCFNYCANTINSAIIKLNYTDTSGTDKECKDNCNCGLRTLENQNMGGYVGTFAEILQDSGTAAIDTITKITSGFTSIF
ncbi:MAG: hypothetical protein K0B02_04920 [DPANN group archaeon]|nr:hypothetical protein [DPANN group archaeon]